MQWRRPRTEGLAFPRTLFLLPPTGAYCREDRCQSSFRFELVPSLRAPLEESEAAGAIAAAGGEALVLDAPARGDDAAAVDALLASLAPDLVVVVATFGSLDEDLAWVRRAKELLPAVTVGLRGAPCYTQPEAILRGCPELDFGTVGDYELVFGPLVGEGVASAPGVLRLGPAGQYLASPGPRATTLDELPLPDPASVEREHYRVRGLGKLQASIRVQRGCPYPCSYCLVHTVDGNRSRHRDPAALAAWVAERQREGTNWFFFRAETFTLDRDWVLALCEELRQQAPGARWVSTTRVERVDDELLASMASAGCYGLSFGVDVASAEIGRRVQKTTSVDKAREAMRLCDRHGILSLGYFMVGFLWETPQTLAETARYIRESRPDLLTIHFATPYPGTRYADQVAQAGVRADTSVAQARPTLRGNGQPGGIAEEELREATRRMLLRHYADPRVLWSAGRKLGRLATSAS